MGRLILVPTPIGNLGDISRRCAEALAECDVVLCEDTRVCSKLLGHLGLRKRMIVYRDDNEMAAVPAIVSLIEGGGSVCLTGDAGTPTISDPGHRIVRECRRRGLPVEALPGPCALTTALAASGLPSDGFLFLGFLKNKSAARIRIFQRYEDFDHSLICYESCHRILKFLEDLRGVVGDGRIVCVARELTKLHEEFSIGPLGNVIEKMIQARARGEYVAIVAPRKFEP
jgi:16S rRNA (cytidine1402-2'-O)-methyltransferase